jgi:hypothetical protein
MAFRRSLQSHWCTIRGFAAHCHHPCLLCESLFFNLIAQLKKYPQYTICDLILFCQIYYFRWKRNRTGLGEHGEETPLLSGDDRQIVEITPVKIIAARYMSALLFVVAVGIAACRISNKPDVEEATTIQSLLIDRWWLVQTLGWSSALLFVRKLRY